MGRQAQSVSLQLNESQGRMMGCGACFKVFVYKIYTLQHIAWKSSQIQYTLVAFYFALELINLILMKKVLMGHNEQFQEGFFLEAGLCTGIKFSFLSFLNP